MLPFITEDYPFITEDYRARFEDITEKVEALPENILMRVRALAHRAGRVTSNGNLYMPTLYKREAQTIQPKLDEGEVLMYPRHPRVEKDKSGEMHVESLSPADAAAIMRGIEVVENEDGTADIFIEADIPKGSTIAGNLAAFIKGGAKVPISSRARGSSTKLRMTDEHPLAKANPEWVGKEVNLINEDFSLRTYDFVEVGASGGSKTLDWREENKEEVTMLDLTKLTEEDWKAIAESDQIKKLVEDAVKAREEALNKEYDENTQKLVDERIEAFIKGDEFAEMVKKMYPAEAEDKNEAAMKCSECGASIPAGSKFCAACGAKQAVAKPKKEGDDEKDAKIEALEKKLEDQAKAIEDLKGENKSMKDERDAEKDAEAVEAEIEKSLKGKPAHVQEQVRADLEDRVLTEDNVAETVKKAIGRVEVIYETAGIDPAKIPAGKGEVNPEDADDAEKKGDLTEGQKNQAQRLVEG